MRSEILIIILVALYVLSPVDLIPGCPIDDLAAVFLALYSNRNSHT